MEEIVVDKAELLKVLRENRDKHHAIFVEALDGYRKRVVEELEARLTAAKSGRKFDAVIALAQPEDHTDDYDTVIGMLEMDKSDEVELDQQQYKQYVRDQWGWQGRFLGTNAAYSVTAAAMNNSR